MQTISCEGDAIPPPVTTPSATTGSRQTALGSHPPVPIRIEPLAIGHPSRRAFVANA
jgi:hypothetical protein